MHERLTKVNFSNFLTFLGIGLYTTEGIGLILPIWASFKDNKNFPKVFTATYVFIIWCYLTLGILSYTKWYDETKHIIFFNFGKGFAFMFIVEVVYAVTIFFSNPINLFPVYESIYKLKSVSLKLEKYQWKKRFIVKYLIRVFFISGCFIICFFVPNFIKFIGLMGSALFPIIGFYIPIMINYTYFKRKGLLT